MNRIVNKNLSLEKRIIEDNLYMTISTCDNAGNPWISNLYFVSDEKNNFYWYSPKDSRHSKLINTNNNVAISIFNSKAVGDDVSAIYSEAQAYEVSRKDEILKGLILYGKKMLKTKFITGRKSYTEFVRSIGDFKGSSPIRLYKAIPKKIWTLAPSKIYNGKYVDGRVEVNLNN